MDYNSLHGPGVSNFSSPSSHRMPTVSAAQALQDLKSSPTRCISTGLGLLDCVLQRREPVASDADPLFGGVSRGKVTEVYGPPGVGKTALGIQLAASALHAGEGVVWVDASHPVPGSRLSQILSSFTLLHPTSSATTTETRTLADLLENLTHFSLPSLAHLIAYLSLPTSSNPPSNTSLIIIDSFSTLISNAFPRTSETLRKPNAPNPSSRKFPILQYLINTLQKLAATRNIAILIFSQCVTKMRPGLGAAMVPSINNTAWEQGLGCRVALFRDWGWDDGKGNVVRDVRFAEVIKAEGTAFPEGRPKLVGFSITESGLQPLTFPKTPIFTSPGLPPPLPTIHLPHPPTSTPTLPTLPQKRKFAETDLEIPDSEGEDDEDYGWAEEDEEELPPPPPQWQGSEDILVRAGGGEEEEEDGGGVEDDDVDLNDGVGKVGEGEGEGEGSVQRGVVGREEIEDSEDELAL